MTPSGNEPATFRLVALYLRQLRHRVPHTHNETWAVKRIHTCPVVLGKRQGVTVLTDGAVHCRTQSLIGIKPLTVTKVVFDSVHVLFLNQTTQRDAKHQILREHILKAVHNRTAVTTRNQQHNTFRTFYTYMYIIISHRIY